jgi:hypothetical protein
VTTILAIDPGDVWDGWVVLRDGDTVLDAGVTNDRDQMLRLARLLGQRCWWTPCGKAFQGLPEVAVDAVVIENIEPRLGQTQGWEVFDTARYIGRMQEAFRPLPVELLTRSGVLGSLGIVTRRKRKTDPKVNADAAVRYAMVHRWGGEETTKKGGPLHGVVSHAWQALAVAVVASEAVIP